MASAVAYNTGPSTIQLEGSAAVSAAKEREAKNALTASKLQHSTNLRKEEDSRKKAENEKLSLERRNESLVGKCNATDHQKMSFESENQQLKGDLSNVKFSYEKETRENIRQIQDIKRDNEIKMEQLRQDYERKLDQEKYHANEMKRNLNEKIEKNNKEIATSKEKYQNKEVEIQDLKLKHKKEMTENSDKLKSYSKKEVNNLIEQHAKDLDERGLEIEKTQEENNKMKREMSAKENDYEQKLIKQGEEDNERFEEKVKAIEIQAKKKIDHVESEKNELERKYLSELKTQNANFDSLLKNSDEKHQLSTKAEKDEFAKVKQDLDGKIGRYENTIKEMENKMIEQENEYTRNIRQQLINKEDELRTNFAELRKTAEDALKHTFENQMNVMKNDFQFKIDRSKTALDAKEEDFRREMEKNHRLTNDLERAERNYRDAKHNARLETEGMATDIELLKKKLSHEKDLAARELRHFRSSFNPTGDSGMHSPDRRGSSEEY